MAWKVRLQCLNCNACFDGEFETQAPAFDTPEEATRYGEEQVKRQPWAFEVFDEYAPVQVEPTILERLSEAVGFTPGSTVTWESAIEEIVKMRHTIAGLRLDLRCVSMQAFDASNARYTGMPLARIPDDVESE